MAIKRKSRASAAPNILLCSVMSEADAVIRSSGPRI